MLEVSTTVDYEDDEVLSELEAALDDASGVDLRASIESAIEERKAALRRELYDHCE